MVSFTDLYNALSTDRLLSKNKIRKVSWYFNNSFWDKPKFSSTTKKKVLFTLQEVTGGNTAKIFLKRILGHFLKIPPLKKISPFQDWKNWKKSAKLTQKKKNSNQKSNQWLKAFKMSFIN